MDRETLVNIVYSGKVRFIPVRRCSLCDEYIGYKFVKMYNGSIIPVGNYIPVYTIGRKL
nr:MAG TPA: Mis18 Yippee zinc-binding/DNA-binding /Mis18, centromere assembly [Caudoviricetes sp.]